ICGNYIRKKYNVPHIWCSAAEPSHFLVNFTSSPKVYKC
ncbi:uncharacterized protein METZ01_LOCUS286841, partial [marine metagenome]